MAEEQKFSKQHNVHQQNEFLEKGSTAKVTFMIPLKIKQNKKRKYEDIAMDQSHLNSSDQFKVKNSSLEFMQSMIEYEQKYKRFKQNCQPGYAEVDFSMKEELVQYGGSVKYAQQPQISSTFPLQQDDPTENHQMSNLNESQHKATTDTLYFCDLCQFEHD